METLFREKKRWDYRKKSSNISIISTSMHCIFPIFLLLLLIVPFAFWWEMRAWSIGNSGLHPLLLSYTKRPFMIYTLAFIKSFILTLSILLLSRPTLEAVHIQEIRNGGNIVFVLDISRSMLAEDIYPNRLEGAKTVIIDFLLREYSNRIWLVVFAGKPFTTVPLSYDYKVVIEMVKNVSLSFIRQDIPWLSGTALWDALLIAGELLEWDGTWSQDDKTIVVLTDGQANIGIHPVLSAKLLKEKEIRVFTVGLGNISGSLLYTTNSMWIREYFRDAWWNPLHADLDERMLKTVSEITGGKYWHGSNTGNLSEIFDILHSLTQKPITYEKIVKNVSLDPYIFALLILFVLMVPFLEWYILSRYKIPKI